MTASSIPFNPMVTTNGRGSFNITSDGFVQGVAMDDPAIRFTLAGGTLAATETLPMWGGVAIYETTAGGIGVAGADTLGGVVGRATSLATIAGFSVFNQAHNWLSSGQSQVPVGLSYMGVNFHRLGSGARIAFALDPLLVATLQGALTTTPVSWDFNMQQIVAYSPVAANQNITGITWANGVATVTFGAAHGFVVNNEITIANVTPAGFNGEFPVASVPSSTTLTYALPVNPGGVTAQGIVVAGGGLLPVRLLDINVGNSKVVQYSPTTGAINWNNSGSAVLALI